MSSVPAFSLFSSKKDMKIPHDLLNLFRLKLFSLAKPSFSQLSERAYLSIHILIIPLWYLVEPRYIKQLSG